MDKLSCIIAGHPALVKGETAVHDKTRGRRPHLRQKDSVADNQSGRIRRCERKCGVLRHCGKNNRAYRLVREVEVSQVADRGRHGGGAGQRESDVGDLRVHGSRIGAVRRRKPNEPQLPARRVLHELEERPGVLFHKGQQNRLRHVGAAIPDRIQILEARRAGQRKDMRFVLKQNRKTDRIRGMRRTKGQRHALVAKPAGHCKRGRIDDGVRAKAGPLRKRRHDLKRFHCDFLSSMPAQPRHGGTQERVRRVPLQGAAKRPRPRRTPLASPA